MSELVQEWKDDTFALAKDVLNKVLAFETHVDTFQKYAEALDEESEVMNAGWEFDVTIGKTFLELLVGQKGTNFDAVDTCFALHVLRFASRASSGSVRRIAR